MVSILGAFFRGFFAVFFAKTAYYKVRDLTRDLKSK